MATPNGNGIQTLPKTIECATARYLRSYDSQFRGRQEEKKRLKGYAELKIQNLRLKAPRFYQEKLPTLVNQAASALLACDTSTDAGRQKFDDNHCQFLRVLDELRKSQPAGDVDFQVEYDRFKEKEQLMKRHLELRQMVDEMEAIEFDLDDLGEEEESHYARTFAKLDRLKAELKRVATRIARMQGEKLEEDIKFELKIVPRSILERLSPEQLDKLEKLIEAFYLEHKRNKKAMYVDKSVIDGMIAKLNIDPNKFTQVEMNQISKDALDAYRTFFRIIENEKRAEYYDSLLKNKHLKPQGGVEIKSPEDIPPETLAKLESHERECKRKLEDTFEDFAKRPCNEELGCDDINDEGATSGDDEIEVTYMNEHSWLFNRIKEEPRDDYENEAPSEDEMVVPETMANGLGIPQENQEEHQSSSSSNEPSTTRSQSNTDVVAEPQVEQEPEEEEFQMLGIVEPLDKVDIITIDDDD